MVVELSIFESVLNALISTASVRYADRGGRGGRPGNPLVLSLLISHILFFSSPPGFCASPEKIVIAVQPTSTAEQLTTQAKEIEDLLERKMGVDVEITFPTSYAGVIEALRFGHAQVAFMGAWPASLALSHAQAQVILAEIREVFIDDQKTEAPYYFSYWVVSQNSPYNRLSDLKGKKVAFPSQLSSSGYVAPLTRLVELGLVSKKDGQADPKAFFSEVLFAGGYAQAWEVLKSGQADTIIIAGDVPESLYQEVLKSTRILEKQGPIPSHTVVVSRDLKEPLRRQLMEGLMEFNKPDYRPLMRKFISGIFVGFQPATQQHLSSLLRMVEMTGIEFTEQRR